MSRLLKSHSLVASDTSPQGDATPPYIGEAILATSNSASKLAHSKRFAWHAAEGETARASVWR